MTSPLFYPAASSRLLLGAVCLAFFLAVSPPLTAQSVSSPTNQSVSSQTALSNSLTALSASSSSTQFVASLDPSTLPDAPLPQQTELPKPNPQTSPNQPSLGDLGLSPSQVKPNTDEQQRLDRRTHDLKVHQTLGLITLAPIAAACISSAAAPPDPRSGKNNEVGRDIHVSLGSLSVAMYGATAYYAIIAPRIPGEGPARGGIKLHKYLIWIHAPGMILTPILGAMAYSQASDGQRVHGIASAHAAVAWTTVAAYSAAILAVSWPIHLPHL